MEPRAQDPTVFGASNGCSPTWLGGGEGAKVQFNNFAMQLFTVLVDESRRGSPGSDHEL